MAEVSDIITGFGFCTDEARPDLSDLDAQLARIEATGASHCELSLYELDLRGPVAILVGNEGSGLSQMARGAAKTTARIPMPGRAESLNASVAGSLALFEAVRQRSMR